MTKKELDAQTQDVICQRYDDWQSAGDNNEKRKEWGAYLCDLMENYIKRCIARHHKTLGAEFEDLMQAGYLAIMSKIDEYDPHISMPTSYFTPYISQGLREAVESNSNSANAYTIAKYTKLEQAARELGYNGLFDPSCPEDELSIYSGESLKTILMVKEQMSIQVVSYDEDENSSELMSISVYDTPESIAIKTETNQVLYKRFDSLTPFEKFIVTKRIAAKPKSMSAIQKMLMGPEVRGMFKDEIPQKVTQQFLEKTYNRAIRKMDNSKEIRRYFDVDAPIEIVEQASADDIKSAFAAGAFDL